MVNLVTSDFADYVRDIRDEKGLSLKDVEIRSGGTITRGYVSQIENRQVLGENVTPRKLKSLAKGLGVSEDELFAMVRGTISKGDPTIIEAQVLYMFQALPSERKIDAHNYIGFLYEKYGDPTHKAEIAAVRSSQSKSSDGKHMGSKKKR